MLYPASSHPSPARLRINVMFDPVEARKVPARIVFQDTGIEIYGASSKLMAEWPYQSILHAFEPEQRMDRTLIMFDQPDCELTLGDDSTYRMLVDRAPHLRREPLLIDRVIGMAGKAIVAAALSIFALAAILGILRSISR